METWQISGVLFSCILFGQAHAAMVGAVSEVVPTSVDGPAGTYPAYVEIFATGLTAGNQFDLVVADATDGTGRLWNVLNVVTLTAVQDVDTYVIHASGWPSGTPDPAQRIEQTLNLTSSFGAARSLILFDHITGLSSVTDGAAELLAEGGVVDVVTYTMSGSLGTLSAQAFDGETIHAISQDDALFRHTDGGGYLDTFTTGEVDDQLMFTSGAQLNPGAVNQMPAAVSVPEPLSAATWALASSALVLRRR